jgi:hypothetical protein
MSPTYVAEGTSYVGRAKVAENIALIETSSASRSYTLLTLLASLMKQTRALGTYVPKCVEHACVEA